MGDLRAADRIRPSGGDRAPADRAPGRRCASPGCGTRRRRRCSRCRRRRCLRSLDLSAGRALALVRAAREVAGGRVDLHDPDHERGWRRLRAIRGIGSWTIQMLALTGQGRLDQLPCGDVGYLKFVGRLRGSGDPWARATEEEVAEFFPVRARAGLAGLHALRLGGGRRRRGWRRPPATATRHAFAPRSGPRSADADEFRGEYRSFRRMGASEPSTITFAISGPIERGDLPALSARVRGSPAVARRSPCATWTVSPRTR